MTSSKIEIADRFKKLQKNVWVEFNDLVKKTQPINLGQGKPDFIPPSFLIDALNESAKDNTNHQYTRAMGHPRMVKALAELNSKMLGRSVDPMTEVIITVGGYSALFISITGYINPGDEVIIVEPFFDCYLPMVETAGGKPVFVPLRPSTSTANSGEVLSYPRSSKDWVLDPDELSRAFTSKTKMIIFCTPNNPLGKVYSCSELELIADLCKKHDVLCISDEVYEWLVYPPHQHIKISSLPGMWDRTITIGSAGKTFHCTGWKTGWCIGAEHLMKPLLTVTVNLYYTVPTILQEALAVALETEFKCLGQPDSYLSQTNKDMQQKRDTTARALEEAGFHPIIPEGGYFMLVDTSELGFSPDKSSEESCDFQFAKWMMVEKGIASIPPTVFFSSQHKHIARTLIRFCFCKKQSTLEAAYEKLQAWGQERK